MITIFTPTYNRGYILDRLYDSLKKQTDKNFEWVIVDDGSEDNTKNIIDEWKKENKILIRYFKQENQGKPIAHNLGVENAEGELFVCVDSDDLLKENAVEIIRKFWKENEDEDTIGIVFPKINKDNNYIGKPITKKVKKATLLDFYNKYDLKGDTMLVYKTSIIKKYRFPKIEGEKFIPENYLYDKLDQEGKLLWCDAKLYVCEYLEDGYTNNAKKLIKNNPKGYCLCAKNRMKLSKNYKVIYKAAAQYVLGSWLANERIKILKEKNRFFIMLAIPAAYIIYLKYYKRMDEKL